MTNNIILAAFLCGLTEFICYGGNWLLGQNMADQPIVVGPLVGLLLGDLQTGIILGAMLEATFIGAVNVGGAVSLNPSVATVLAVAYAIIGGGNTKAAVALAIPMGLLGGLLEVGTYVLFSLAQDSWTDAADKADEKKLVWLHYGVWFIRSLVFFAAVFITVLIGVKPAATFIKSLPAFVENGLGLTGGLLPAAGFAMLLSMVWEKKLAVWYFLGFVLVEYVKLPLLVVGIVGLVFAVVFAFYDKEIFDLKHSKATSNTNDKSANEEEEEDFLS